MSKTPAQRFAFKSAFLRDQRLARKIARGKRSAKTSKSEARALADQAATSHPITRIEPKPPAELPRQQLGGRSFFKSRRTSQ
jgi:hypothetical protein